MNKRTAELVTNLCQANAELGVALVDLMVAAKDLYDATDPYVSQMEERAERNVDSDAGKRASQWRAVMTRTRQALNLEG